MIYIQLFYEFFKTGLFALGGGLATLPFLHRMAVQTGWFSEALLTDMIAISESTPGPIGVNMATYVGYVTAGIPGALVATLGLITPAVVIVLLVVRVLDAFRGNRYIEAAFYGLRPAVVGLIAAAGLSVAAGALLRLPFSGRLAELIHWPSVCIFAAVFLLQKRCRLHPIWYLAASAVVGVWLGCSGLL